jgi:hypothetical protein
MESKKNKKAKYEFVSTLGNTDNLRVYRITRKI